MTYYNQGGDDGSGNNPPISSDVDNGKHTPVVRINGPKAAFGELLVTQKVPQVQIKFPYGIHPDIGQTLVNGTGSSASASDGQAIIVCGGAAEKFAQIRTKDTVRYGPGEGALKLGTCAFTAGVADSSQVFGAGDDDEGFFFGYNGENFGILHRSGGSLEIKRLEITGAADAGGGDFTITLDGSAVTVTVGASATIPEITASIVALTDEFGDAGRGWEVLTDDNISVCFISLVAESAGGSFSFADVDSGVTAGSFTTPVAGANPTETWYPQSQWNIDRMLPTTDANYDSSLAPSGMILDQTKGNVYGIEWQYLGYGEVDFAIEREDDGIFQPVHRLTYTNANTIPSLVNPTLHLTAIAKTESGYSGGDLTMKTASMAGFIEGYESRKGVRRSISVEKNIGTTEAPILILYNNAVFNNAKNKISVYPDYTSFATESGKPTTLRLYKQPTEITGAGTLTEIEAGVSTVSYGLTGTGIVGGERLLTFIMQGNGGGQRDLSPLDIQIRPGERYVVTAQVASGANSNVNVSYTWIERI